MNEVVGCRSGSFRGSDLAGLAKVRVEADLGRHEEPVSAGEDDIVIL